MDKPSLDWFDKLRAEGFKDKQIYQLVFLQKFWSKKNNDKNSIDETFKEFIKNLDKDCSVDKIEQYIKCITHNIPYKLFMETNASVEQINETRRFLEDTIGEEEVKLPDSERYIELAKQMMEFSWDSKVIYQVRRFAKSKYPLGIESTEKLCKFIIKYNIKDWIIINELYDIYNKDCNLNKLDCIITNKEVLKALNISFNRKRTLSDIKEIIEAITKADIE